MSRVNYKKIYEDTLAKYTARGVKIYHRKIPENENVIINGFYDIKEGFIVIKKELYGTKNGLEVLFHEIGHLLDHKAGKYKLFFKQQISKFTKSGMKDVVLAERSAARYAKRQCAKYGIKITPEELTDEGIIRLQPIWLDGYFSHNKKRS